jgi:putative nucleotidyltransferase with HDIG domain
MKTISELIEWFQLNYPELVRTMRISNHHRQVIDDVIVDPNIAPKLDPNKYLYDSDINPYHIEGNVWTHSMLVCKQAENEPYLIQLAALFHDIGKPITRSVNPKNGYVSFYNHDAVSAFMSLEITKKLKLSTKDKIQIFNMLALHTQIFKQTPDQLKKLFIGQQELADNFIRLGRVDNAGRFTKIPSHTWTEFFNVEKKPEISLEKEVILMCGLPGSGKSSYIRSIEKLNKEDYFIVSRDDCLMNLAKKKFGEDITYNEAFKKITQKNVDKLLREKYIESNKSTKVFVDMTHMSKKSRKKTLSYYSGGYKKTCVLLMKDLPTIYLQNEQRKGKVIDRRVIKRMMKSFSCPMLDEFDEIKYIF